jgi:16S rRNA (cytidine1402-2'-O)-methyltransferase
MGSGRAERLDALRGEQRTTILYEAPHRVRQTVAELADAFGSVRRITIVRELTKLHEEVWRGTLGGAVDHLAERDPRGEYVLVLGGAEAPPAPSSDDVTEALRARLAAGDDKKTATTAVAKELRVPKRTVYEIATRL